MSEILLAPAAERPRVMQRDVRPEVCEDDVITPNDMVMAKQIADVLGRHYPNHPWMVHVNGKQGIAVIRNRMLSGQWGYVLKLKDVISATDLDAKAMKAGGEILERFRLKRGQFNGEHWAGLPTNVAGVPLFFKD